MPIDSFKPMDKKAKSPGGKGPAQYPVIGVVKDNIDATRSGRIRVALQDGKGSTSPDSASGWVTVQHLTSFFGVVRPNAGEDGEDYGSYVNNSSSYGQWQAPPDIGTKVICIFVNGDTNAGFYIGSIPEPETLQMVPAIGASEVVTLNEGEAAGFGGATRLPVTNLNTNNKDKANSDEFLDTPRPVHSYTASIMNQQGILRDPVRGPISSSASREAASRVGWGVSTPGRPIYEGGYTDENLPDNLSQGKAEQLKVVARRGGHSIVMDDGDIIGRDQLIRIRTALGHQIMMSDDGQTLMILHSNGQSYIELGKEGTVDIFSTNSINMRTQGDFNIHADRDINMHAAENFNVQAKNIHTNSEEITKARAGKDFNITSLNNFTVKSSAAIALNAGGQASMVAGAESFINGSKVNLNSGSASLTAAEVPIIPLNAQADTLFDKTVGWAAAPAKLLSVASRAPAHYPWVNAGMGVDIKASPNASDNLPEPSSSAVQQVNKQAEATNPTPPQVATVASVPAVPASSATLGQGPTNAVLAASATAAAASPAAEAAAAGAGVVNKTGGSLISGINSALNIASTVSGAAGAVGGAINTINQVAGAVNQAGIAVGSFAQSAQQLAQSGVLKPGAGSLVDGLASAGKTLTNVMPAAVFAGVPGAETVQKLAANSTAQAASLVNIMQSAQQQLTQAGVINGTESTTQTAGLIAAASTVGTEAVVNTVKQVATVSSVLETASSITNTASSITGIAGAVGIALPSQLQSATTLLNNVSQATASLTSIANGAQNVLGAIGSGISAAKLSDSLGGLGGISNSLNALSGAGTSLTGLLDSVKGVAGSAFSAIKDSFGKLEANKPQFLSDFAKQTAAITAVAENTTAGQLPSSKSLSSLVTGIGSIANEAAGLANNLNNTIGSITGAAGGILGSVNNIAGTVNSVSNTINSVGGTINSIGSTLNSVGSTINSVTGAAGSIAGTVNNLTGSLNNITTTLSSVAGASPGLSNLPNTINPGTINNTLVNATGQLATTAGSIVNTVNSISNTVNNLGGAAQQVTSLINSTTGASVNNLANSISGAFDNINSMAGAATSLKNGLSGLANAAKKTQAGGLAAKASQLSSGVSNLPGGIKAFSSVLDKADDAFNKIPGTDQLTGIMNNLQTDLKNGIGQLSSGLSSVSSTLGQVSSAVNTATSTINSASSAIGSAANAVGLGSLGSIASKAGGLTSSIASKLPIGQATQLLSSVSALGAGGASPIKLPSLGINTSDRTDVTSQLKGILGDPKIPEPNLLGDIKDETISSLENKLSTLRKERDSIVKEGKNLVAEREKAYDLVYELETTLPEGDPKIKEAVDKYIAAANKVSANTQEFLKLAIDITESSRTQVNQALAINSTLLRRSLG
jgi:archaellum component FlaC